jgi:chromatin modification-related protein YNG2
LLQNKAKLEAIASLRLECKKLADKKIELADEVLSSMGVEMERVDSDLETLEESMPYLGSSSASVEQHKTVSKKVAPPAKKKYISKKKMELILKRNVAKKEVGISIDSLSTSSSNHPLTSLVINATGNADAEEDDDKNVYCLCSRPSFGEMVACENQSCRVEWFHTPCVGLSAHPDSVWFCPECIPMMTRKSRN